MSGQLDWQVFEEGDGWLPEKSDSPPIHKHLGNRTFWLFAIVFFCLIVGGWGLYQQQLSRQESKLRAEVQSILDFEEEAFQAGDGDLFFSVQDDDPAWVSAQLQPGNQGMYRANGRVSKVEAHGDEVWANVVWREEDKLQQRIAFFRWQNGRFLHVPTSNSYWGPTLRQNTEWGELLYPEVDASWVEEIDRFTIERIEKWCTSDCLQEKLPLTLILTTDYSQTAVPHYLHIPSPRLIALFENGHPATLFWEQLDRELEAYLTPAVVYFAVPPNELSGTPLCNYEYAAARFMAQNPEIKIEISHLENLPEDPYQLAREFDGAVYPLTPAMITSGQIYDLTDFVASDPDFDQTDFYEQIWQGAQWQGRLWMMPLAAQIPLLFYDQNAFWQAEMPEPYIPWTWGELEGDLATIISAQPEESNMDWGYLDTGLDTLFSYSYCWITTCWQMHHASCQWPFPSQNVAAALSWYKQRISLPGQMPDLTAEAGEPLGLKYGVPMFYWPGDEREKNLQNWQKPQRKAVIWVDSPANFESQFLLAPVGVVSFPGSGQFEGITPLWVQGAFISQRSERPYAVWQWLKFLSYQPPTSRLVPARRSVAEEMGYWTQLPKPLDDVMQTAFSYARPVTIEDQTRLTWEQVTAVASGKQLPAEAARQKPNVLWFGKSAN